MSTHNPKTDKFFHWNPEISIFRNAGAHVFKLIGTTLIFVFILLAFSGPLLLVFSIYQYLKTGDWFYYDNAAILYCFGDLLDWLREPQSWFGLHRTVKWMFTYLPMGLLTIPVGLFLGFLSGAIFLSKGIELHEKPATRS